MPVDEHYMFQGVGLSNLAFFGVLQQQRIDAVGHRVHWEEVGHTRM